MTTVEMTRSERRAATRYLIRGCARLFWPGGDSSAVSLFDMSASGCAILGDSLPHAGTRVFLSLDIGGLPNVRLPAVMVRRHEHGLGRHQHSGVQFELPRNSMGGLDRLLARHTQEAQHPPLRVLLVDSQARTRERIAEALRAAGVEVTSVATANDAMVRLRAERISMVFARGDLEGLSALGALSRVSPETFRVVFGRGSARDEALRLHLAQASADDPCSAKCLGTLLKDRLHREDPPR